MDDGDWDWIFELGFWAFAPISIIIVVVLVDAFNWPVDLGLL